MRETGGAVPGWVPVPVGKSWRTPSSMAAAWLAGRCTRAPWRRGLAAKVSRRKSDSTPGREVKAWVARCRTAQSALMEGVVLVDGTQPIAWGKGGGGTGIPPDLSGALGGPSNAAPTPKKQVERGDRVGCGWQVEGLARPGRGNAGGPTRPPDRGGKGLGHEADSRVHCGGRGLYRGRMGGKGGEGGGTARPGAQSRSGGVG